MAMEDVWPALSAHVAQGLMAGAGVGAECDMRELKKEVLKEAENGVGLCMEWYSFVGRKEEKGIRSRL